MSSDNETNEILTPPNIMQIAEAATNNLLPTKSRERYEIAYQKFIDWRLKNNVKSFSENVMLAYFQELSDKMKPSSLWAFYSMLRTTINLNHYVNIASYSKLLTLLKRRSDGFKSKKSKVLTAENINDFLKNASDSQYLFMKTKNAKFSCEGRISGYYADVTSGCQVYHMCDGLGRQFSYTCPNATLFQQRMLICDHWYMVNCSRSEEDYSANLLIGQKKPFVEDSEINPYHRTPRPDLLSHPSSASEYNIIYRTGGDHDRISKNIVGAEDEPSASTDESNYFPPSHWSTAYEAHTTTSNPNRGNFESRRNSNQNNIYKTNYSTVKKGASGTSKARPKAINFDSPNRNGNNFADVPKYKVPEFKYNTAPALVAVNYKSSFKATTPVFPLSVESSSVAPSDIGILAPDSYKNPETKLESSPGPAQSSDNSKISESVGVDSAGEGNNYPEPPVSNIDTSKYNPAPTAVPVNYKSNFSATTPVFPLTVEDSSIAPNDIGILPPIPYRNLQTNEDTVPPNGGPLINFQSNFKATTPVYPTVVEQKNHDEKDTIVLSPPSKNSNVNFESDFKATTPVYPTSVEPTSPNPGEVGLLPPNNSIVEENGILFKSDSVPGLSLSIEPPQFDENYKNREHIETTVAPPSMFYQPPKFEPDFTSPDTEFEVKPGVEIENLMKSLTVEQWQNIRQKFLIPEYDFPLDDATRPSYDSLLNSFAAKPAMKK